MPFIESLIPIFQHFNDPAFRAVNCMSWLFNFRYVQKLKIDLYSRPFTTAIHRKFDLYCLYLFRFFLDCKLYHSGLQTDSRKTFINQEWLVVESCPTPRWTAFFINALSRTFLVLCRLVCNICSHFNVIILVCACFQKNFLRLISFPEICLLVLNSILTCFCIKGWYSKVTKYNSRNSYSFRS